MPERDKRDPRHGMRFSARWWWRRSRTRRPQGHSEASSEATIQDRGREFVASWFGGFTVICLRHFGAYSQVSDTWAKLTAFAVQRRLCGSSSLAIGIVYDDPTTTPSDLIRYDACLSIDKDTAAGLDLTETIEQFTGLRIEEIDGVPTWRITHRGDYSTLFETYRAAFETSVFKRQNEAEPNRKPPYYEVYRNSPRLTPAADLITEIHLPWTR